VTRVIALGRSSSSSNNELLSRPYFRTILVSQYQILHSLSTLSVSITFTNFLRLPQTTPYCLFNCSLLNFSTTYFSIIFVLPMGQHPQFYNPCIFSANHCHPSQNMPVPSQSQPVNLQHNNYILYSQPSPQIHTRQLAILLHNTHPSNNSHHSSNSIVSFSVINAYVSLQCITQLPTQLLYTFPAIRNGASCLNLF